MSCFDFSGTKFSDTGSETFSGTNFSQYRIFSKFAYFLSKIGKIMNQMSIPPFWEDVGVRKWSPFLDTSARSPILGHLIMGTFDNFGQKCPCSGAQKWDFKRPKLKKGTTFSRQHPPKMVE